MLKKGQTLHVAQEWLEDWRYSPKDFEIGAYWAFVISKKTGEIQFFERIPGYVHVTDFKNMLETGDVGEYKLEVDRLFREEEFTFTDDDEGWIVQINQIQPYVMAELITPILLMPYELS